MHMLALQSSIALQTTYLLFIAIIARNLYKRIRNNTSVVAILLLYKTRSTTLLCIVFPRERCMSGYSLTNR